MGKSTVIQSLMALRQSYLQRLLPGIGLALNGDLAKLGTGADVLFEGALMPDRISISLVADTPNNHVEASWSFTVNLADDMLDLDLDNIEEAVGVYNLNLFTPACRYLQAERIGPRVSYAVSEYQVRRQKQIGVQGEYAPYYLSLFGSRPIAIPSLAHPRALTNGLKDQVEAWMGDISPGVRPVLEPATQVDAVSLQFSVVTGTYESKRSRAINAGFGLSYTLPVLVAILAAEPGSLLLIENPEAHLHPSGQALMGELLARVAQGGVQVIVETHSDHVLNGVRLAVHGGGHPARIIAENVRIHFFEYRSEDGNVVHTVTSPTINRDGRLDKWPKGFFDEGQRILMALLEPRSE